MVLYNVNSRDIRGRTALHTAAESADLDQIKALLKRGANPNIRDWNGETPLFSYLLRKDETPQDKGPLFEYALFDTFVKFGSNVNIKDKFRRNMLHRAASKGKPEHVIKILVDNGVGIRDRDGLGRTPVDVSKSKGDDKTTQVLEKIMKSSETQTDQPSYSNQETQYDSPSYSNQETQTDSPSYSNQETQPNNGVLSNLYVPPHLRRKETPYIPDRHERFFGGVPRSPRGNQQEQRGLPYVPPHRRQQQEQPNVIRWDPPAPRDDPQGPRGLPYVPRDDPQGPRGLPYVPRDDPPAPRGLPYAPREDQPAPRGLQYVPREDQPAPRGLPYMPREDQPAPRGLPYVPRDDPPAPRRAEPPPQRGLPQERRRLPRNDPPNIFDAVRNDDFTTVRNMMGDDLKDMLDEHGRSAIFYVQSDRMLLELKAQGFDPKARDHDGVSVLMYVIEHPVGGTQGEFFKILLSLMRSYDGNSLTGEELPKVRDMIKKIVREASDDNLKKSAQENLKRLFGRFGHLNYDPDPIPPDFKTSNNIFEIFGVDDRDMKKIGRSYRKLARIFHPDKGGDKDTFSNISSAYQIFAEPDKYVKYLQNFGATGEGIKLRTYAKMKI